MRDHGKNWAEIAGRVGTKTDTQCRRFYRAERQAMNLDDLVAFHHTSEASVLFYSEAIDVLFLVSK